jgi:membrane-associated protein
MHFLHSLSLLHFSGITDILNPAVFLKEVGPWALVVVVLMVFIETGLLFPFLPGDSLAFAAGVLLSFLGIPLWLLILIVAAAAIAGGHSGYALGTRIGPRLFKDDARIFKTRYRLESEKFFQKYGSGAIVLARFVPIVRTYVPPVVGMSSVPLRTFALWNAVGGLGWSILLCVAGFYLGKIPIIAHNVELIAVALVLISVLPIVIAALVKRRHPGEGAHVSGGRHRHGSTADAATRP